LINEYYDDDDDDGDNESMHISLKRTHYITKSVHRFYSYSHLQLAINEYFECIV